MYAQLEILIEGRELVGEAAGFGERGRLCLEREAKVDHRVVYREVADGQAKGIERGDLAHPGLAEEHQRLAARNGQHLATQHQPVVHERLEQEQLAGVARDALERRIHRRANDAEVRCERRARDKPRVQTTEDSADVGDPPIAAERHVKRERRVDLSVAEEERARRAHGQLASLKRTTNSS